MVFSVEGGGAHVLALGVKLMTEKAFEIYNLSPFIK